jgi:hypothetical protein
MRQGETTDPDGGGMKFRFQIGFEHSQGMLGLFAAFERVELLSRSIS